jgi:hypothetical protein
MLRTPVATLIAALAMTACSSGAVPTAGLPTPSVPPQTAVATTMPPATATPQPSTPSAAPTATDLPLAAGVTALDFGCKDSVARCQNMPAGTYETSGQWAFLRGLTLTLPAGWSSAEQDAGEFELHQGSDANQVNQISFWIDVVPWVNGEARPELGTTADGFADYLLGDTRLTVSEGPTRTFGVRGPDSLSVADTVQARSLSVILSDSATTEPDVAHDCPAEACIGLLTDPVHWQGASELLRDMPVDDPVCLCSEAVRLYVASIGRDLFPHTLVIAVATAGADPLQSLAAWEAQVEPIIDSVLVPYIVVDN